MCGFAGVIGQGVDPALLGQTLPTLLRRGPDSYSHWVDPRRRVGLIHTRLAIVDPDERANQPFASDDGTVVLAFNGEIYNYRALRACLSNYDFKTDSDTEVLLALYLRHGAAAWQQLEGMFSIALVDLRLGQVSLFRDAIGKKPYFLAQMTEGGETQLCFGSSVSALLAMQKHHFGRCAELRADALGLYWQQGHMPADLSAFKGVAPLLPGQLMVYGLDGTLLENRRIEPETVEAYNGEDAQGCSQRVTELLARAIALRLDGQPRATVLLSGGIDSTVVSTLAYRQARKLEMPIGALSLGAWLPLRNDEYFARYAARRDDIPVNYLRLSLSGLAQRVCSMLDLQDEPLGFVSYFLLAQLVREAANYAKILLTGDGGDEVFFGYRRPEEWRSSPLVAPAPNSFVVGPKLPDWVSPWGRSTASSELLGHGLVKADRASAEQGVELRCPLLDWRLLSYVRSLPFERLFPHDTPKSLLKQQLSDWPNWFVERKKSGFTYHLRWHWSLTRFSGLRESFEGELAECLKPLMPASLRVHPSQWTTYAIFSNFTTVWKALAWQRFLLRNA